MIIFSCLGKRTKEGANRGSEFGTVQIGRDGKGPVPLRKPKEPQKKRKVINQNTIDKTYDVK